MILCIQHDERLKSILPFVKKGNRNLFSCFSCLRYRILLQCMMLSSRKSISWLMLAFYIVSMVVLIPLHHDLDIFDGSGRETVAAHTGHDQNVNLNHKDECPVCSGLFGRTFVATAVFSVCPEKKYFCLIVLSGLRPLPFEIVVPFYHRGPPSLLG